jgi:type II secretory pathway pseudopilin PulG
VETDFLSMPGCKPVSDRRTRGFTFIDVMIVIAFIAIVASIAIPKYNDASQVSAEAALMRDLQLIRQQIERYRALHGNCPDLDGLQQWEQMIDEGYLHHPPVNPLNGSSLVVNNTANGPAGWIWDDGKCDLYALDWSGNEQFDEDPDAAPNNPSPPKGPPDGVEKDGGGGGKGGGGGGKPPKNLL